ncbi:hypothetical protein EON63_08040 [archaeon]|nr:MAG: hypothetical protein EON63_08040 [archaeon]
MSDFHDEDIDSYLRMEEEIQGNEEDYLQYMEDEAEGGEGGDEGNESKNTDSMHAMAPEKLQNFGKTRNLGVEERKGEIAPGRNPYTHTHPYTCTNPYRYPYHTFCVWIPTIHSYTFLYIPSFCRAYSTHCAQ